ncbi:MAG: glycerate kinase [Saprospiraceae bacterium]|nr:glycerate kinase [Saprospiraceae bacterium]
MSVSILIACDKFKGTLSAIDACQAIKKGIHHVSDNLMCDVHAMADGGEGSLSSLRLHIPMQSVQITVSDPLGRPVQAEYGYCDHTAYIETAAACGLQHLNHHERNPLNTSTYGVGLMIMDAIQRGCQTIHLFVGGSATHDGGAGMASACGFRFTGKNKKILPVKGSNLQEITGVIPSPHFHLLHQISFFVWADVRVPICGPNGAASLFARQKGANPPAVTRLDGGLKHLSQFYSQFLNKKNHTEQELISDGGAAGGLAAGCAAFLGGRMGSGFQFISETTGLNTKILAADYVISGEGSIDNQSVRGKVISGIAEVCKTFHKPLILACGKSNISTKNLAMLNPLMMYTMVSEDIPLKTSFAHASQILEDIGIKIGLFISDHHK